MADTTIKVDSTVRDRLIVLAAERGPTIRALVAELAGANTTREELDARYGAATVYLREHLCPTLTDADLAVGERFWREVEAERLATSPDALVSGQQPE